MKVIVLKCNSFKTLLLQSRAGVLVPSHSELAVLWWEGTLEMIFQSFAFTVMTDSTVVEVVYRKRRYMRGRRPSLLDRADWMCS